MTTFSRITISGIEFYPDQMQVTKSLGDTNASSKFTAQFNNYTGRYTGSFGIGNEVLIYCDKDINPPTTQIFTGILEDVDLQGKENSEKMTLTGRDYSARMMDKTVEPEVYNNLPAGSIVKDIITKYTDDITADANVSDGETINRIIFNHTPVFDAVRQLAKLTNYMFYVDNSKDLHFKEKTQTSSGYTFGSGGTQLMDVKFKEKRDGIYNEIWVYGDRYLDGYTETFTGDGTGSVFTLGYKPSNTAITVDSALVQPGAIYQMTYEVGSKVKYLVNYSDKQIIFTSGTSQGDNIPGAGSQVVIDYMRDLPIVKVGENDISIDAYGRKTKIIQDTNIKDPLTAETILLKELNEYSDPLKQGTLYPIGIGNLNAGETCVVNIPSYNINSTTYDILEAKYDMNKQKMLSDEVLSIKVNKKIPDITDTLKDLILQQKRMSGKDFQTTDLLTRYKFTTGSFGIRQSGLEVYTRSLTGSALVYNSVQYGIYNTNMYAGEGYLAGFIIGNLNAGILGTSELGEGALSPWALQWSGGYW